MRLAEPVSLREPLSQHLRRFMEIPEPDTVLTVNQIMRRTGERGVYLVIVLLSLPFVAWISVPGTSMIFGPICAMLAWQLALGRPPHLPAVLGDRELSPRLRAVILKGGLRFTRFLEKYSHPRRSSWMRSTPVHAVHCLMIMLMAVMLALPFPAPPCFGSNALPSYAMLLMSVAMMEEDGVLIWFGYAAFLLNVAYFTFVISYVIEHGPGWLDAIQRWLGHLS